MMFRLLLLTLIVACKPPKSTENSARAGYNYKKVKVQTEIKNPNEISSLNTVLNNNSQSQFQDSSSQGQNQESKSSEDQENKFSTSSSSSVVNSADSNTVIETITRKDRHYRITVVTGRKDEYSSDENEEASTINSLKIELKFDDDSKKEFILQNTRSKTTDSRHIFGKEDQVDYFDFEYQKNYGNLKSFRIALRPDGNQSKDTWIGKKIKVSDGVEFWEMQDEEVIGKIANNSYTDKDFLVTDAQKLEDQENEIYNIYLKLHTEHKEMNDRIQIKLKGHSEQGTKLSTSYKTLNDYDNSLFSINKDIPKLLYKLPVELNNVKILDQIFIRLKCDKSANYNYDQLIFASIKVSDSKKSYLSKYEKSDKFIIGSDQTNASWAYECSFYNNLGKYDPVCKKAKNEKCI